MAVAVTSATAWPGVVRGDGGDSVLPLTPWMLRLLPPPQPPSLWDGVHVDAPDSPSPDAATIATASTRDVGTRSLQMQALTRELYVTRVHVGARIAAVPDSCPGLVSVVTP